MPYIDIQEIDLTTPESVMESTDVVFIPGFVDITQESLQENGKFIGLQANRPYLFTDVNEFITLCGDKAPIFNVDQLYGSDFEDAAIPDATNRVFLPAGTPDPSYIMAKELLASGLSVLYQRVNGNESDNVEIKYDLVDSATQASLKGKKPVNTDPEYFYKNGEEYSSYQSAVTYPNFSSYVDEAGAGTVYSLNTLEYASVNTYWNNTDENITYYVVDGKVVTEVDDPSTAKFKDSLLIKNEDGTFVLVGEKLPTNNPENAVYALPFLHIEQPSDWTTSYTAYYDKSNDVYTLIPKIDSSHKNYESGNIYSAREEISSAFNINKMYTALSKIFSVVQITEDMDAEAAEAAKAEENVAGLIDKGNFSVKYLTSGGYPVFEHSTLANSMLTLAEARGDCIALIDHTDHPNRELNPHKEGSLYKAVLKHKSTTLEKGEFGAMFTPWATYSRVTKDSNKPETPSTFRAPGSYAYLLALADSIKTNANWLAVAGAARGGIKNLIEMTTVIPNGVADTMQPRDNIAVNAITNIKPYGYTIWGNRTLKDNAKQGNLVATSFLNIRNLVSDVKKTCYRAARKMTFEQDTDVLWINFKAEISKLLNQMKSGYGISGYKIIRDTTHVRANDKATLCAKVVLYPTYAVEDFYITIVLKDDEVTVE